MIELGDGICESIAYTSFRTMDNFFEWLKTVMEGATSTGNQFGAGSSEYYFYVPVEIEKQVTQSLEKTITQENLSNVVSWEF